MKELNKTGADLALAISVDLDRHNDMLSDASRFGEILFCLDAAMTERKFSKIKKSAIRDILQVCQTLGVLVDGVDTGSTIKTKQHGEMPNSNGNLMLVKFKERGA